MPPREARPLGKDSRLALDQSETLSSEEYGRLRDAYRDHESPSITMQSSPDEPEAADDPPLRVDKL